MPAVGGPSSACDDSGALIKSSGASASIFRSAFFIVFPCGFLFLPSETIFYAQSLVNPSPRQSERSGGDAWEAARPEQYSRRPAWRRHDAKTMGRSVKAWNRRRDDRDGPWLTFNPCGPTIEHSLANCADVSFITRIICTLAIRDPRQRAAINDFIGEL